MYVIFKNEQSINTKTYGNFLENDFWTPPPPLLTILYMDLKWKKILNVRHVAAELGP